jgi:hypothetical protein
MITSVTGWSTRSPRGAQDTRGPHCQRTVCDIATIRLQHHKRRTIAIARSISSGRFTPRHDACDPSLHRGRATSSALSPESVFPSSIQYQNVISRIAPYFTTHGASLPDAQHKAITWVGQEVANQAALLSYIDVFWALGTVAIVMIPVVLLLLGGAKPGAPTTTH